MCAAEREEPARREWEEAASCASSASTADTVLQFLPSAPPGSGTGEPRTLPTLYSSCPPPHPAPAQVGRTRHSYDYSWLMVIRSSMSSTSLNTRRLAFQSDLDRMFEALPSLVTYHTKRCLCSAFSAACWPFAHLFKALLFFKINYIFVRPLASFNTLRVVV